MIVDAQKIHFLRRLGGWMASVRDKDECQLEALEICGLGMAKSCDAT